MISFDIKLGLLFKRLRYVFDCRISRILFSRFHSNLDFISFFIAPSTYTFYIFHIYEIYINLYINTYIYNIYIFIYAYTTFKSFYMNTTCNVNTKTNRFHKYYFLTNNAHYLCSFKGKK